MDLFYLIALFGGCVWGFLFCDWYRAREARKQPATKPVTGHVTKPIARLSHHIDVAPYKIERKYGHLPLEEREEHRWADMGDYLAGDIPLEELNAREQGNPRPNVLHLPTEAQRRHNRAIIDGANAHYKRH